MGRLAYFENPILTYCSPLSRAKSTMGFGAPAFPRSGGQAHRAYSEPA
jgi:hypothetical protein